MDCTRNFLVIMQKNLSSENLGGDLEEFMQSECN